MSEQERWRAAGGRAVGRWSRVVGWAFKATGGELPRRRRAVLKLAGLAIEAEWSMLLMRRALGFPAPRV